MNLFEFMEGCSVDHQSQQQANEELDNQNLPVEVKLFDFLNGINHTKIRYDMEDFDAYNPFVINRFLSYSMDTCMVANIANMYPQIPHCMQYSLMKQVVRKRKRFNKWIKPDDDDRVKLIMENYNYSMEKAKAVMDLFTDEQIVTLKENLYKGGVVK